MNQDDQKNATEEAKFRAEIAETVELAEQLPDAQDRLVEAEAEEIKARNHHAKCAAAAIKLRGLQRDYPGYFPKPEPETDEETSDENQTDPSPGDDGDGDADGNQK